jgi:hypothetical protein
MHAAAFRLPIWKDCGKVRASTTTRSAKPQSASPSCARPYLYLAFVKLALSSGSTTGHNSIATFPMQPLPVNLPVPYPGYYDTLLGNLPNK